MSDRADDEVRRHQVVALAVLAAVSGSAWMVFGTVVAMVLALLFVGPSVALAVVYLVERLTRRSQLSPK